MTTDIYYTRWEENCKSYFLFGQLYGATVTQNTRGSLPLRMATKENPAGRKKPLRKRKGRQDAKKIPAENFSVSTLIEIRYASSLNYPAHQMPAATKSQL